MEVELYSVHSGDEDGFSDITQPSFTSIIEGQSTVSPSMSLITREKDIVSSHGISYNSDTPLKGPYSLSVFGQTSTVLASSVDVTKSAGKTIEGTIYSV